MADPAPPLVTGKINMMLEVFKCDQYKSDELYFIWNRWILHITLTRADSS